MQITLMTRDRKSITPLPVVSEEVRWGRGMTHQTVETVNNGEILILGRKKLMEISIDSFLPENENDKKKYSYSHTSKTAREITGRLERWRDSGEIIRVIITKSNGKGMLNILMVIEEFMHGIDRSSDVPYSLKLKQYKELG